MKSSIINFMIAAIFITLLSASVFAAGYDVGGNIGIYIKVTNDTSELNDNSNPAPAVLPDNYVKDNTRKVRHSSNDDTSDSNVNDNSNNNMNNTSDNYYNNENPQNTDTNQPVKDISIIFQNHVGITGQYQTDDKYAYTGEEIISQVYVKGDGFDSLIISLGSKEAQCKDDISSLNYGDDIPEGFSEQGAYDESMKYYTCTIRVDESISGDKEVKITARDSSGNDIADKKDEFFINMPLVMDITPANGSFFVQNSQLTPLRIEQSCNSKFMTIESSQYKNVKLDDCKGNIIVGTVI